MPTALIGAAITGGASLVGGLLGRKKTSTQVQQPTYTPGQTQLQNQTGAILSDRLANPTAQFDPLKTAALDANNKNYASATDRLQTALTARGFGGSGKFAAGVRSNEIARAGTAGGIEADFAGKEVDQQNKNLQDALRFSFATPGSKTQTTGPGNVLGGAAAGGAQTATFLYALNHMMGGGGVGGGGETGRDGYDSYQGFDEGE